MESIYRIIIYALLIFHQSVSAVRTHKKTLRFINTKFITIHEEMGYVHFPPIVYNEFVSKLEYSTEPEYGIMRMDIIFDFTHFLFELLAIRDTSYLMPDYIANINSTSLTLGQKYENNDWLKLILENRILIAMWILPLMVLVILMPFVAVIYCCFGCFKHKACHSYKNPKLFRTIYSIILFLLILGLLLAFVISIVSLKQMNRNYARSVERLKRGSRDTCVFLEDVSRHLHHLLVTDFNKLMTQGIRDANDAHNHILLDLLDVDGNALSDLEKLLKNLENGLDVVKEMAVLRKAIVFLTSIFRDNLRGINRDYIVAFCNVCGIKECIAYVREHLNLGVSKCLHLDDLLDIGSFIKPMEKAIEMELYEIPQKSLKFLKVVSDEIRKTISPIIPVLTTQLKRIDEIYKQEYELIDDIIKAAMSDILLRILRTSNLFEDIHQRFGADRQIICNIIVLLMLLIIIALIFSLFYGLFVRKNKAGSYCLIFVVMFMLFFFSIVTLNGLFYYVLGMVTYQSTCRPSKADSVRMEKVQIPDAISACREDQNIFDLLKENNLYDLSRLYDLNIEHYFTEKLPENNQWGYYVGNLSTITILSLQDIDLINKTLQNLNPYHGSKISKMLCKQLSFIDIAQEKKDMKSFGYDILYKKHNCYANNSEFYHSCNFIFFVKRELAKLITLEDPIKNKIDAINAKAKKLDALITMRGMTFGETLEDLVDTVLHTQAFIRAQGIEFINTIGANLTESIKQRIYQFRERAIKKMMNDVGSCKPLAYIQDSKHKFECRHLIDPINGLWVGLILSSLLYLPTIFVGHLLICLYRAESKPKMILTLTQEFDCPTCSGAPYRNPTVTICSGPSPENCYCQNLETVPKNKRD